MGAAEVEPLSATQSFHPARVERVFNDCFAESYNTRLFGGADGTSLPASNRLRQLPCPLLPRVITLPAHCTKSLTGVSPERSAGNSPILATGIPRKVALPTSSARLSWWSASRRRWSGFSARACGYRFQVSADNPDLASAGMLDTAAFQRAVLEQALVWQKVGLPATGRDVLCGFMP